MAFIRCILVMHLLASMISAMPTNPITRRRFLAASAAAAVVGSSASAPVAHARATNSTQPSTTQAARKLNIGIVGVGGRGFDHVREAAAIPNANIVALCDVDVNNLVQAARRVPLAEVFV